MSFENSTPCGAPVELKNVLSATHREILADRAISVEAAQRYGLVSVHLGEWKRHLQRHKLECKYRGLPLYDGDVTAILIPYPDCRDGIRRARCRIDQKEYVTRGQDGFEGTTLGENGEIVTLSRYIAQASVPVAPFVTFGASKVKGDISEPIVIAEAALKAISVEEAGWPAIGLGGVLAGGHDPVLLREYREISASPDLKSILWKAPTTDQLPRLALIAFDAGITRNPQVALGAAYLAEALRQEGATVHLVLIPYHHGEESHPEDGDFWDEKDQGPDDYIRRNGVEAFAQRIRESVPADPAERIRYELERGDVRHVAALLDDLPFQAMLHVRGVEGIEAASNVSKALKAGPGKRVLQQAATKFAERLAARAKEGAPADIYRIADGCIFMGERRLARFTARIEEQVLRDDGQAVERVYKLAGKLADGTELPTVDVRAKDFAEMKWVHPAWGSAAIIEADRGAPPHTAVAIQTMSAPTTRKVFTSLGWRDGTYHMPGLSISRDGSRDIEVSCGDSLVDYDWSGVDTSDEAIKDGVRLSLSIRCCGEPHATIPALGAAYGAPLANFGWDHVVWLYGESGSLKSTLAALAQAHWGKNFDFNRLPQGWGSTTYNIEGALFAAADALMVVDNYVPAQTSRDQATQISKALQTIQHVGDRQARGRQNADMTEKARKRPRCVLMATGEILPPDNASTLGRCLLVHFEKGKTVNLDEVRALRVRRDLLRSAMAGYVRWLASKEDLRKEVDEYVNYVLGTLLARKLDCHERTKTAIAWHMTAWHFWLEFAEACGAIVEEEGRALFREAATAYEHALKSQPRPEFRQAWQVWLEALRTMKETGRIDFCRSTEDTLVPVSVPGERPVPLVGWIDGETLLLHPGAVRAAVSEFLKDKWTATETELHSQLRIAMDDVDGAGPVKVLAKTDGRHVVVKRSAGGGRPRVLVLDRRVFGAATFDGPRAVVGMSVEDEEKALG
jgi:Domain of unknown function (DUF3854)